MGDWSRRKQLNGALIQKLPACIYHILLSNFWHPIIQSLREHSEWIMSMYYVLYIGMS